AKEIERVNCLVVAAVALESELAQYVAGRFSDERDAVPIVFGEAAGGVKVAARAGGISAEEIHLPDFFRHGKDVERVGDRFQSPDGISLHMLVVAIGNGEVPIRIS